MLVLSRKRSEKIHIGKDIVITVIDLDRGKVRLGIECPREVPIFRRNCGSGDGRSAFHSNRQRREPG